VRFTIETEQEEDGRWIAEVRELPGALAYGRTRDEAIAKVEALGLRVLADRLENSDEAHTSALQISFASI
jgi:predicted RNase H-like HicB family nuclease